MLLLPARVGAELVAWSRAGYPREACGLLLGREQGALIRVERAAEVRNLLAESSRERFELDPAGFVAADLEARAAGRSVVGVWHSHPDHPAEPSPVDLAGAFEGWSYLILSVGAAGVERLRSWRLSRGRFEEEELHTMSQAVIRIPTPLRGFTQGRDEVAVECATVSGALEALGASAPGILERVLDGSGRTRPFVNLFLGARDVRTLGGLSTPVEDGAVISIVPAVAGGRTSLSDGRKP